MGGPGGYPDDQSGYEGRRRHRETRRGRRRAGAGDTRPTERWPDAAAAVLAGDDPTGQIPVMDDGPGEAAAVPVSRTSTLAVAGCAALLTLVLVLGALAPAGAYAAVVFAVQALYVAAWATAARPPAPRIVAGVGLAAAVAADVAATLADPASLAPLAYVVAAGFVAGVVGQLARRAGRDRVTESLGSTLVVVVGAVSLASLVVLARHPRGTQAIVACLLAAGAAVAVARLTDAVAPRPRFVPDVPRGRVGVLLGVLVGTGAAAAAGSLDTGVTIGAVAAAGLATALIAVVVDLSVSYVEAGRRLAGMATAPSPARLAQGPLGAFALAAPVMYAASALLLLDYL
ncbi:hypothetical protein HC031_06020 [Planosporangium thailandense]|uniref:CDP-diglyceride synthetase n=1 Tax=Planosporangium thailandense TaxID=765197 RepID=A0ABX0XTP7_9ACTN|nr:hypothetical protein [Planosporangium thailandense]